MSTQAVIVNSKKIALRHARAQVRLTQQELSRLAKVSRKVIVNAEHGTIISQISAWAILNTLNRVRANLGLTPLTFEQMDWKVEGEK